MFAYTIKSAIYLSIMYIPYMLMLRKESFFTFNRVLLLCIMVLSLVLPLCNIHLLAWSQNPIPQGMIQVGMPIAIMEEPTPAMTTADTGINWISMLFYAYLIGTVITFIYKAIQFIRLYRLIHHGVLWKENRDGITIYCHAQDIASFSWFHTIVLSESDYNDNATEILRHEMGHITHHHSWDIMLLNIVQTIQWCNPLVWILASSLRDVHEYEADDAVLRSGVNARQYQTLLIRKAVGSSSYTFANSFNHSLLKKRITMMLQKRSNPWMRTKALYVIPVAVIALSAFATPELNNRVDAIAEQAPSVIADKGTTNSAFVQEKQKENADKAANEPASIGDFIPVDDNDNSDILYLIDGKETSRAELNNIQPIKILNITVVKKEDDISKYISKYTSKKGIKTVILISTKDGDTESAATTDNKGEKLPKFPGGEKALMDYMAKNAHFSKEAIRQGSGGRVVVEFVVEKDGTVSNVKARSFNGKSINEPSNAPETDAADYAAIRLVADEAERMVRSMPKWEPGTKDGEPVSIHFFVPVIIPQE